MTDKDILAMFKSRSEQALVLTQEKYGAYCIYIAEQILGSPQDAEECFNEALNAAWHSIPPAEPENIRTYLGKLTRNAAISRLRERTADKRCPSEFMLSLEEIEEVAVDDDLAGGLNEETLARAISDFLRSLPELPRCIMIRRYWFNDPIRDICKRYGLGESRVKVTLKRTRDKLASYLRKEGLIP